MNSSQISNCRRSKSSIFVSRNINSLLWLRVEAHIIYNIYIYIYICIYIYIYIYIYTGSRNENNIGAACGSP